MCSSENIGEIIILSDDDDDDKAPNDPSVVIVEVKEEKTDCVSPQNTLEEDLVVTFSRRADVLPHARYDCPVHPFTAAYSDTVAPLANNQLICDQCFCYICDKLASSCVLWSCSGVCHCNSHKKSDFWNDLRNNVLLGELKIFNITLSEVDSHLRRAETMLQNFKQELCTLFSYFMLGNDMNQQSFLPNYTPVFEFVLSFLNKADKQDSRAAAILNLGAAQEFIRHFEVKGPTSSSHMANVSAAKIMLMQRVITSVRRLMVMADLAPDFIYKLQDFYLKRINLPADMRGMRNSLCVRPWTDVLLVSVLRGQNVSGVRKEKGKKDLLFEQISVVLLRTELLQRQSRYRELCRYLRVVRTDDSKLFQRILDLLPFFLCMEGNFTSALTSLLPAGNSILFTPQLFLLYLRIFKTATAPKVIVSHPGQLCSSGATWEPIKDAVPLKRVELVKFALRALRCSPDVYTNSQCWTSLLTIVNSPLDSLGALPEPSPQFLHEARDVVNSILVSQQGGSIQIPRSFLEVYPDQALLLLVTGALSFTILNSALRPALPALGTFKDNLWAFHWLCEGLSSHGLRLEILLSEDRTGSGKLNRPSNDYET